MYIKKNNSIGHNSQTPYKKAFYQLLELVSDYAGNHDDIKNDIEIYNETGQLPKLLNLSLSLNSPTLELIKDSNISTYFGNSLKENIEVNHKPQNICGEFIEYLDAPFDNSFKEKLITNLEKDLADQLIKDNNDAWSWYTKKEENGNA